MSTDTLTYVLSCLRRSSENAYPWSLTPNEAGLLVAEIERLRQERAAVVTLLREDERMHEMHRYHGIASVLRHLGDIIERGEHRREEE